MDILVLHAPTGRRGSQKRAKLWTQTADLLALHADPGRPLVVLMDSNARLGSVCSGSVGPHAPEPQNEPGAALH
eukprot:3544574-Lingulodinium_polyedra.AAC.1